MSERGLVACRRTRGEDMISLLPDHLLCEILSHGSTKRAVMTSVLSTRWRTIWLSIPGLVLGTYDFPNYTAFASFVSKFLYVSKFLHKLELVFAFGGATQEDITSVELWKFALKSAYLDPSYLISQWIKNADKALHLDIMFRYPWNAEMMPVMPLSIYTCVTLVSLKLHSVSLPDSEYVSLPCLKIMHLEDNVYANDAFLEKLISSCPVLEKLEVVTDEDTEYDLRVLRVRSKSLTSLDVDLDGSDYNDREEDTVKDAVIDADTVKDAVIDAPGLTYLNLKDHQSTSFVISKLSVSAEAHVNVSFDIASDTDVIDSSKRSAVRNFFTMISNIRGMTLCEKTLQIISLYLKHEQLPQFPYLIWLNAYFCSPDLGNLPNILQSFPNLKSLVLELEEFKENEVLILSSSSVPECLRSSLEHVVIYTPIRVVAEIELVKYFLENSAVLKKLKLCVPRGRMNEESNILMELLRLRRCSPSCEVVVDLEELREGTCQSMKSYYNFF